MLGWLTVLELTAAALVVLGVLSVIAHFVNQARAKASATDSGKMRTVERPSLVATPEPRNATPPAVKATSPAPAADQTAPGAQSPAPASSAPQPPVVAVPLSDDVPPSSASLLPPVEPIPPASDTPPPTVEAIPPAGKIVSGQFSRLAKPHAVPASRLKNAVPLKTTRSSKIKRRPKRRNAPNERRISLAPVAKAKPAVTRRPKRVMQIRRKKITAPVRGAGKAVTHRSPRLAPA